VRAENHVKALDIIEALGGMLLALGLHFGPIKKVDIATLSLFNAGFLLCHRLLLSSPFK